MTQDKTSQKYLDNPKLHLKDLIRFRDRIAEAILGEEDKEYRSYLEFVKKRTNDKIKEINARIILGK